MSSVIQELQEALRLEQEECARLCEQKVTRPPGYSGQYEGYGALEGDMTGPECAAAIRARSVRKPFAPLTDAGLDDLEDRMARTHLPPHAEQLLREAAVAIRQLREQPERK